VQRTTEAKRSELGSSKNSFQNAPAPPNMLQYRQAPLLCANYT